MSRLTEEIKRNFKEGDGLSKLILINLGVYAFIVLLNITSYLFQYPLNDVIIKWLALPSDLVTLATRPWTLVSYMFLHEGFLHILFNLLWLYFSGRIFIEYMGSRKLIGLYILGGLGGGILYIIFYNVFPIFSEAVSLSTNRGASAGVMAIIAAIATYRPNFIVRLIFNLELKLWILAAVAVASDLIFLPDSNPGGHIAHLGGAAIGYLFGRQILKNKDITEGINGIIDSLVNFFKPRPKIKKVYSSPKSRTSPTRSASASANQDKVNEILDKISKSGYESLSKQDKDFLFRFGKDQ